MFRHTVMLARMFAIRLLLSLFWILSGSGYAQAQVIKPFGVKYSGNVAGNITMIGNALQSCQSSASACSNARSGIGKVINNNDFVMDHIDVDADASTFNSSRAALELPSGAEVLSARLYWAADTSAGTNGRAAPTPSANLTVKFQVPGSLTYQSIGPASPAGNPYQCAEIGRSGKNYAASCDVTALVKAAGNGGYTVANVQAGTGENRYAGWVMVVAYRHVDEPSRNLTVFEGYAQVSNTDAVSIPVTGFRAPPSGSVRARIGAIAFEGDLGITGDMLKLNGFVLSDAQNPATNFFNSNFTILETPYTARTPNFPNLMAIDANVINTVNLIPNNATSATLMASTSGDTYFPVVLTSAIEIYAPSISAIQTALDLNGGGLAPGDTIEYRIQVSNTGYDSATQLVLSDTLPAGTVLVPGSLLINQLPAGNLAEYDALNNRVRFRLGSGANALQGGALGVNETVTLAFRVQVDPAAPDEMMVANVANLDFNAGVTGAALTARSNLVGIPVSRPILVVGNISSSAVVQAGTVVSYTVPFSNDGTAPAHNTQILYTLPGGMVHESNSLGVPSAGQQVLLPIGNLPRGASGSLTILARVNNTVLHGQALVSQAEMSADGEVPVAAQASIIAISQPFVTLAQSASVPVAGAGNTVAYTFSFRNAGTASATGVTLKSALPVSTQFVSATGGGVYSAGNVEWALGTIPPGGYGSVSYMVKIDSTAIAGTELLSTGQVQGGNIGLVTASAVIKVVDQPVFSLKLTPSVTRVAADSLLTYTLDFSNVGTGVASNTVLYDVLQPYQQFSSATGGGLFDPTTNTVSWPLGALAAGQSGSVTVTVRLDAGVDEGRFIRNRAALVSPDALTAEADSQVVVFTQPQLELRNDVDKKQISPGDTLTYTLSYANTGRGDAINVFIDDVLPDAVTFVSASAGGSVTTNRVHWALGTLKAGTSGTVNLTVQANAFLTDGQAIVNAATLNTPDPLVQPASAMVTSSVSVQPVLELQVGTKNSTVAVGEQQVYTLQYSNKGSGGATGVVLVDILPEEVKFVSAGQGGIFDPLTREIRWFLPDLPPNMNGSVDLTVQIEPAVQNGTTIVNVATLQATGVQPVQAVANTLAQVLPKLILTLSSPQSSSHPGGQIDYVITVHNEGNAPATGVRLLADLPVQIAAVSAFTPGGVYDPVAQQILWTFDRLESKEVRVFELSIVLPPGLADGVLIDHAADVSSKEHVAQSAFLTIPVSSVPLLDLGLAASPEIVKAGEILVYNLKIANKGYADAEQARLFFEIPDKASLVSATGAYVQSGNRLEWPYGLLPVGQENTESVTVQVQGSVPNGMTLSGLADLQADNAVPRSIVVQTVASSLPHLNIDHDTVPPESLSVQAGSVLAYQTRYRNSGTASALNTVVVQRLSAGMGFVTAVPAPSSVTELPDGTTELAWSIGETGAYQEGVIDVTVQIASPLPNGTVLNSRVQVTADDVQPMVAAVEIQVQSKPALTVTTTSSANPVVLGSGGSELIYTINFSNHGTDDADLLNLRVSLPPEVVYISHVMPSAYSVRSGLSRSGLTPAALTESYDPVAHEIVWSGIGPIAPGESGSAVVKVMVPSPMIYGTVLSTTVYAQAMDGVGAFLTEAETTYQVMVQSNSALSVTNKAVLSSITAGSQNTYVVTLSNPPSSTDAVHNWSMKASLPLNAEVAYVSAGSYDPVTHTVSWSGGSIAPGRSMVIEIVVEVPQGVSNGTVMTNVVTVQADNILPQTVSESFQIQAAAVPMLAMTASKAVVLAGDVYQYEIYYSNTGSLPASGLQLKATLPQVGYMSAVIPADGGVYDSVTNTIIWPISTLFPGTAGKVSFAIQVSGSVFSGVSPEVNAISLDSSAVFEKTGQRMAQTSSKTAVVKNLSQVSALVLEKALLSGTPEAGTEIVYVLRFSNTYATALQSLVVVDTLPVHTDFISASDNGSYDPDTHSVSWPIGDLGAGSSGEVTVRLRIHSDLANGSLILNKAFGYAAMVPVATPVPVVLRASNFAGPVTPVTAVPVNSVWMLVGLLFGMVGIAQFRLYRRR